MRMTNNTNQTLNFLVAGAAKNGVPPTDALKPGETKDIDVVEDDAGFKGHVFAGTVTVSDSVRSSVEAAIASPDENDAEPARTRGKGK